MAPPHTAPPLLFAAILLDDVLLATQVTCLAYSERPTSEHGTHPPQSTPFGHWLQLTLAMDAKAFETAYAALYKCLLERTFRRWTFHLGTDAPPLTCAGMLAGFFPSTSVYGPGMELEIYIPPVTGV